MEGLRYNILAPDDLIPECSTDGSAGFDLKADLPDGKTVTIQPGESHVFGTGVILEPKQDGWMCLVYSRSGISTRSQVMLLNGVAVIDPDYRGVIHVPLINLGKEPVKFRRGDRIAQLCFCPFGIPQFTRVAFEEMSKTSRGDGRFGHTGI